MSKSNPNRSVSHTPGPWRCTKYPKVFSINAESGRQIAIMTEHHGDCPMVPMSQFERSEQDAADARLIASAPELLEALCGLIEIGKRDLTNSKYDEYFNSAQRAITKAKGGAE